MQVNGAKTGAKTGASTFPEGHRAVIVAVMLIVNPGFIHPLFADPIGHALVVGGITLQTLGYFVIRKIIRIQV